MTNPFDGAEDLTVFLVDGEHAEEVTITVGAGSVTVTGVFFDVFNDDGGIDSAVQYFLCVEAAVSAVEEGETLTRDDLTTYTVRDKQPDGTGLVTVMVHRSI